MNRMNGTGQLESMNHVTAGIFRTLVDSSNPLTRGRFQKTDGRILRLRYLVLHACRVFQRKLVTTSVMLLTVELTPNYLKPSRLTQFEHELAIRPHSSLRNLSSPLWDSSVYSLRIPLSSCNDSLFSCYCWYPKFRYRHKPIRNEKCFFPKQIRCVTVFPAKLFLTIISSGKVWWINLIPSNLHWLTAWATRITNLDNMTRRYTITTSGFRHPVS